MVKAMLTQPDGRVLGYKDCPEDILVIHYGGANFVCRDAALMKKSPGCVTFIRSDTLHTNTIEGVE